MDNCETCKYGKYIVDDNCHFYVCKLTGGIYPKEKYPIDYTRKTTATSGPGYSVSKEITRPTGISEEACERIRQEVDQEIINRLSKALDKACELLAKGSNQRTILYGANKNEWKEWLLKDGK